MLKKIESSFKFEFTEIGFSIRGHILFLNKNSQFKIQEIKSIFNFRFEDKDSASLYKIRKELSSLDDILCKFKDESQSSSNIIISEHMLKNTPFYEMDYKERERNLSAIYTFANDKFNKKNEILNDLIIKKNKLKNDEKLIKLKDQIVSIKVIENGKEFYLSKIDPCLINEFDFVLNESLFLDENEQLDLISKIKRDLEKKVVLETKRRTGFEYSYSF